MNIDGWTKEQLQVELDELAVIAKDMEKLVDKCQNNDAYGPHKEFMVKLRTCISTG